jgi:hypothetical protein
MRTVLLFTAAALAAGLVASSAAARPAHGTALRILHVQKGCHTWSTGKLKAPALKLSLRRGGVIDIHNQDVDAHRLVQVAGPKAKLMQATMMMNGRGHIMFSKPGVYRFKTKVVEMEGMPEIETSGPDQNLVLTVTVT